MTLSTKHLDLGSTDEAGALGTQPALPGRDSEPSNGLSRKMERTVRTRIGLPENMIESDPQYEPEHHKHNQWLVLIAVYKALQALLFVAVGIGALRLLHKDIDEVISQIGDFLRFNPESRVVNFLYDRASLINDPLLKRIGALAFSYAGLSMAEGIGLFLEKAWGEYLTLAITASFLPWEVFEVFHRLTWMRVGFLVVNTLVFFYLMRIVASRRRPIEASDPE